MAPMTARIAGARVNGPANVTGNRAAAGLQPVLATLCETSLT
jgi:hypothetical protein